MDLVASLRTQDTVPRIWYGTIPKRVIHEPDHGKIGPDWKPVNWVWQGKIPKRETGVGEIKQRYRKGDHPRTMLTPPREITREGMRG
jgi:hypothetical protein